VIVLFQLGPATFAFGEHALHYCAPAVPPLVGQPGCLFVPFGHLLVTGIGVARCRVAFARHTSMNLSVAVSLAAASRDRSGARFVLDPRSCPRGDGAAVDSPARSASSHPALARLGRGTRCRGRPQSDGSDVRDIGRGSRAERTKGDPHDHANAYEHQEGA